MDHGVLSDEQEGLIDPSEESTGLTQKLADKILSKNDQIIIGDDGVKINDELDQMNIVIQDSNQKEPNTDKKTKVVNYETFESSSEDEFSQGAFESAA